MKRYTMEIPSCVYDLYVCAMEYGNRHLALDGTYGAYETFKTYCNV